MSTPPAAATPLEVILDPVQLACLVDQVAAGLGLLLVAGDPATGGPGGPAGGAGPHPPATVITVAPQFPVPDPQGAQAPQGGAAASDANGATS
ncbi:hypothetical protein GCM10009665_09540 [Kitasatospora nipponensis]|uniref:Uncharacterized protein n=1 Tax=Kitasatospora nipponensis TaxID=258049 RepID=A0ABP4GKN2_9ACTN